VLNNVSNSASDLQCHSGSLPNDRDGTSVMALSLPAMWRGCSGDTRHTLRRKATSRMSCPATRDPRAAIRHTQLTVGEVSLKRATWEPGVRSHTVSITIHKKSSPANSRSEFVRCPPCLVLVRSTACLMSGGHSILDAVGLHARLCPTITPPNAMYGGILDANEVRFAHDEFSTRCGVYCSLAEKCPAVLDGLT
jgi:hypothetical protein